MDKKVYFLRHAESEENADRIYRGPSAQLTENGRQQARLAAERVARIGVDGIMASPYPRAKDTAAAIGEATGLSVELNPLLGEWAEPSSFVGKHRSDPHVLEAQAAARAALQDHHHRHSDEETFAELSARAREALRLIETDPRSRLCVVTHGGFLRMMIGVMVFGDDLDKKRFHDIIDHFYSTNTGITYARHTEGRGWQVITWNDQAHLG